MVIALPVDVGLWFPKVASGKMGTGEDAAVLSGAPHSVPTELEMAVPAAAHQAETEARA